ncbi:MAG: hypothetical protein ACO1RX_11705 [Candidatus Sericytochromatia bacterium]
MIAPSLSDAPFSRWQLPVLAASLWSVGLLGAGVLQLGWTSGRWGLGLGVWGALASMAALLFWVQRRHARLAPWVLFFWLAVGVSTGVSGPLLLNALQTPPGHPFVGITAQEMPSFRELDSDQYTYLAKLRQGHQGEWLYTNRYTEEQAPPAPLFGFHLGLGQVLRVLGVPPLQGFWLLTAVFSLLPLLPLAWLSARLFPEPGWQSLALFCSLFGLGWSWLKPFLSTLPLPLLGETPPDLTVPELTVFQILGQPHFAFALSCLLGLCVLLLQPVVKGKQLICGAILAFLLAWVHPFDYVQMGLVALVYLGLEIGLLRTRPLQHASLLLAGSVGLFPAALIWWTLSQHDVLTRTLIESNHLVTPHPLLLALGFGSSALFLLPGLGLHLRKQLAWTPELKLLWVWLLVGLLLAYGPIPFQRRFLMALYLPALLLSLSYLRVLLAQRRPAFKAVCLSLFVATLLPTTLKLIAFKGTQLPMAQSHELHAVLTWLNTQEKQKKLVFSQSWLGLLIPAFTPHAAWVGHWSETLDYASKKSLAAFFWQLPLDKQQQFLALCQADFFLVGPEDALAKEPAPELGMYLVYASGPYRLYHRPWKN